jgi:hypothetical protein
MNGDLLRLQHGKVPGHDLVLRQESRSAYLLAVVSAHQGSEVILHSVHLKTAELSVLAKVLIDILAGAHQ